MRSWFPSRAVPPLLLIGLPATAAGECTDLVDYGEFVHVDGSASTSGAAFDVEISGATAYVGGFFGLEIYDVSDPTAPTRLGGAPTADHAYGVAILAGYAYVADGDSGLTIIDVRDPSAPSVAGRLLLSDQSRDVAVRGEYAYVADHLAGLAIVDVSDASNPVLVHTVDTPSRALGVDLEGDHAYVAGGSSGVQIIDISSPETASIAGAADTPGEVEAADAQGVHVYCADHDAGFTVIDVSDPTNPFVALTVPLGSRSLAVAVRGDVAYVTDVEADGKGIVAFDISERSNPIEIVSIPIGPNALAATNGYLYAAGRTGGGGLLVLDVRSLALAPRLDRVDIGDAGRGLHLSGSLAYVAQGDELQIVDVTPPFPARLRGAAPVPGTAYDVFVSGNTAYVSFGGGLQIVDVTNPDAPVSQGSVALPGLAALAVVVAGDHAYVANAEAFRIVDVSNPLLPLALGDEAAVAVDVVLVDGYALVADKAGVNGGIRVVNVFDPQDPRTETVLNPPFTPEALALEDDVLYVASGEGLEIIDVSDVLAPVHIGGIPHDGSPEGVAASAGVAYLVTESRLDVFDVTDPGDIRHVGTAFSDRFLAAVAVGDRVHVLSAPLLDTYSKQCPPRAVGVAPSPSPSGFRLGPARPNPFRAGTAIAIEIPASVPITLRIYDVNGRRVRALVADTLPAGTNEIYWDGRDDRGTAVPSGVYVSELEAERFRLSQKLTLAR